MSSPNVKFRASFHGITRDPIVEVWSPDEKQMLGVLYPTPTGVRFVSKHITNHERLVVIDPGEPPSVYLSLAEE